MLELLRELTGVPGCAGFEGRVAERIVEMVSDLPVERTIDPMGSVIVKVRGKGGEDSVMVCVHMDEVGLIVRHLGEDGYVRFGLNGGVDQRAILSTVVDIHSRTGVHTGVVGVKSSHLLTDEERERPISVDHLWIDLGARSRKELEAMGIRIGDPITYHPNFQDLGRGYILSKAIDNRAGCAVLVDACRKLVAKGQLPYDLYMVAAVQEEIGSRGARVAAQTINPTIAIVIDTTPAMDPMTLPQQATATVGEGPVIRVMDSAMRLFGTVYSHGIRDRLVETAEKLGIRYQVDVASTFTDAATIHIANRGVPCGGIYISRRCAHSPVEVANITDIEDTSILLQETLRSLTSRDLEQMGKSRIL